MNEISPAQYHMFFEAPKLARWLIFPKGRRLGATRGAAIACTKWMREGKAILWGDTIHSNIERYIQRFFIPFFNQNRIKYYWNQKLSLMKVGKGYIDFRSSDIPKNWEGFGYNVIILNEAGIILDNEYLYYNAVLPMMMDDPNSILIAPGTPKVSRGIGKLFKELWGNVLNGQEGYYGKQFTTYDNPYLTRESILSLEKKIAPQERDQEISGKFVDSTGLLIKLDWFCRYEEIPVNPIRIIQSWDTASSSKQVNDPSVCTTWYEYANCYYLVHVFRKWIEYPMLVKMAVSLAEQYSPDIILIENKSSGISLIQDLKQSTKLVIHQITPVQDKITRALITSGMIESGRIVIPRFAEWLFDYEKEWSQFPKCVTFDQIDSTTQFLRWTKKPDNEILI